MYNLFRNILGGNTMGKVIVEKFKHEHWGECVKVTNGEIEFVIKTEDIVESEEKQFVTAEEKEIILKSLNQKKINKDRLKLLIKL